MQVEDQHLCLLLDLVDGLAALMDYCWTGLIYSSTHMGVPLIPASPSITTPQTLSAACPLCMVPVSTASVKLWRTLTATVAIQIKLSTKNHPKQIIIYKMCYISVNFKLILCINLFNFAHSQLSYVIFHFCKHLYMYSYQFVSLSSFIGSIYNCYLSRPTIL